MSIIQLLVNSFLRKCYRSQNQEIYIKAKQVFNEAHPSYFQLCMFVSKQLSDSEMELLGHIFNVREPLSQFCELQLRTFRMESVGPYYKSVWMMRREGRRLGWRSKRILEKIDKGNLPQGTFLQIDAIGDLLQELDAVKTMSAQSCLLHPSLQFIAELEAIKCPPIINVVNEDGALSVHDKLRLQFRSAFDYTIESGSAVTHVLVNCKAINSTSVAELYIAVNGIVKRVPEPLVTRLVSEPWPIEGNKPLEISEAKSGFQLKPHPLLDLIQNLVVFVEISSSEGIFEWESKLDAGMVVGHVLAAVKQLNIQYEMYRSSESTLPLQMLFEANEAIDYLARG